MKFHVASTVVLLSCVRAKSLLEVLDGTHELSSFRSFLEPSSGQLIGLSNITLLAPNNRAVTGFLNSSLGAVTAASPDRLRAILDYHIIGGVHTTFPTSSILRTALQPPRFSNVTGGQQILVTPNADASTTFTSGLLQHARTNGSSLVFDGGVIYEIDSFLRLPQRITATATTLNLTSVVGAIQNTNLTDVVEYISDITMLLPINSAFKMVGGNLASMSTEQLTRILLHHVVNGTLHSGNQTLSGSMAGLPLISQIDTEGNLYVDNAKVLFRNVPVTNGIIHIIDKVLNPDNYTVFPPSSVPEYEFAPATTASDVPFTSGVPTPSLPIPLPASIVDIITGSIMLSNPSSTETLSSSPSETSDVNTNAIKGGVIGGICGLVVILSFWFFVRRRRASKMRHPSPASIAETAKPGEGVTLTACSKPELEASVLEMPVNNLGGVYSDTMSPPLQTRTELNTELSKRSELPV